ncbi:MAG: beta-galactosidase [Solirubrobacteraceae bacterium]|nr:beta-galactosidase [Solirubrobacteraceae bacterium]
MMPILRVATAALVGIAVAPGAARAADDPIAGSAAVGREGVGTSSDGLYALFPDASTEGAEPSELFGELSEEQTRALKSGVFVATLLRPAPGDPGTASASARATDGQASARAGVQQTSRWLPLAVAFCVTLLLAVGLLSAPLARTAEAKLPVNFAGVTAEDVYIGSDSYQATQLARQRQVGFTTIRQVFRWNELEPAPGIFDFSATDRFVLAAARAGIRVMPLLFGEPAWATSRPAGSTLRATFPPRNNATFANFARTVAARYGPGGALWSLHPTVAPQPFDAYQLWNEPNLPLYWGGKVNSAAYARFMIAGSAAIRAVQPKAVIVSGGLPDSRLGLAPAKFLRGYLKAGGGPATSAVGVHPYALKVATVVKLTRRMRTTLDRTKSGRKVRLWVTELGWAAGGPPTRGRTVSRKEQAKLVSESFKALARSRKSLKLSGVVYFAWRDLPPYPGRTDFWGLRTGLLTQAGTDKPAVKALTNTIKRLR